VSVKLKGIWANEEGYEVSVEARRPGKEA